MANTKKTAPAPSPSKAATETTETKEPVKVSKIYRANAERFRLWGWRPEKRAGDGRIIETSQPVTFEGFLKVTDDPEMQKFIESSAAFRERRDIVLEPSVEVAMRHVNHKIGEKRVTANMESISEETKSYQTLNQIPANIGSVEE